MQNVYSHVLLHLNSVNNDFLSVLGICYATDFGLQLFSYSSSVAAKKSTINLIAFPLRLICLFFYAFNTYFLFYVSLLLCLSACLFSCISLGFIEFPDLCICPFIKPEVVMSSSSIHLLYVFYFIFLKLSLGVCELFVLSLL